MDEELFKTATTEDRDETCPQCGVMSTYKKENYYFS